MERLGKDENKYGRNIDFIPFCHNVSDSLTGRRPAGTDRNSVVDWSSASRIKSQRGSYEAADQSQISRQQSPIKQRLTTKPSWNSYGTSAILINFEGGEVIEWLQCTVYSTVYVTAAL